MKLVVVLSLLALDAGCEEGCWAAEGGECTFNDSHLVYEGESFNAVALTGAADHFVALVQHADYTPPSSYGTLLLVDLDPAGGLLSVTDADPLSFDNNAALGTDGDGSAVIIAGERAHFLRNGVLFHETDLGGEAAIQFGGGAYWIAVGSRLSERKLLRYDTTGTQLDAIEMPDTRVSTMPSVAIDPLGHDLAAGWQVREPDLDTVVLVHRIRGEVSTAFEVGRMRSQGWVSPVAIHDGTIAILFGRSDDKPTLEKPTLALVSPDGQISTREANLPESCENDTSNARQFVGTIDGYLLTCRDRFVTFDVDGTILETRTAPDDTRTASTTGATLALSPAGRSSVEARPITGEVGEPTVLFEGTLTSEEVGGCLSSTRSPAAWWLVGLALLGLRRRPVRRARTSASPGSR